MRIVHPKGYYIHFSQANGQKCSTRAQNSWTVFAAAMKMEAGMLSPGQSLPTDVNELCMAATYRFGNQLLNALVVDSGARYIHMHYPHTLQNAQHHFEKVSQCTLTLLLNNAAAANLIHPSRQLFCHFGGMSPLRASRKITFVSSAFGTHKCNVCPLPRRHWLAHTEG